MRQTLTYVLAYACAAIATGAIVYGFWIMSRISRDLGSRPKDQQREVMIANLPRYVRSYFSVFFVLVAILIALFLTAVAISPD
jgi:hypothetical protein